MAKHKAKKHGVLAKLAVGSTIGALVAAGAAAFFFTQTKQGKAAAKNIKSQAVHLSKEISKRLHKVQKVTQITYNDIVDQVVDEFAAQKKVGAKTVQALKRDLQRHWKAVQSEMKKG